jgi:hypothetical protein
MLFDQLLADVVTGNAKAYVGPRVIRGRLYPRALYVSELIGNWRSGL